MSMAEGQGDVVDNTSISVGPPLLPREPIWLRDNRTTGPSTILITLCWMDQSS